jgi:hypothetical protein
MKTRHILPFVAGLALAAGFASPAAAAAKPAAPDNVTVTFQDPDRFTDVQENQSTSTSTYYLDELRSCLQQAASPLLTAGQKLVITVTDIDLAGDNNFSGPDHIRIMKDIYVPRVHLRFQLLGADGKVVKEGTRNLTDMNYTLKVHGPGFNEPLYYDKALLREWVGKEFRS